MACICTTRAEAADVGRAGSCLGKLAEAERGLQLLLVGDAEAALPDRARITLTTLTSEPRHNGLFLA